MEHLVISIDSEKTLIVGVNQYSPISMIDKVGKYSELSKRISNKKEHTVYFDAGRVQGFDSKHRFVVVSVEFGVADKYGFYFVPKEELPSEVLSEVERHFQEIDVNVILK